MSRSPRRTTFVVTALLAALAALSATTAMAAPGPGPGPRPTDGSAYAPTAPGTSAVTADPGTRSHPYLFTQAHRDNLWWWNGTWLPQSVPDGAHVQVQLPGGPARWQPYAGPGCRTEGTVPGLLSLPSARTTYLGQAPTLPNEGRIDGYSDLQRFDYTVHGQGIARICLRPDPMLTHPQDIGLGNGKADPYVLSLLVGIPQLSLSAPL